MYWPPHAFAGVAHVGCGCVLAFALVSCPALPPLLSHLPGAVAPPAPIPAAGILPLRTVPVNLPAEQRDLSCVVGHLAGPRGRLQPGLPAVLSNPTPGLRVFRRRHPVTRLHLPACKPAVTAEGARHPGRHDRRVPAGIHLVRRDAAIRTYPCRR